VTKEPVQRRAVADGPHARRAGAVRCSRTAPEPAVPHAPQPCPETEPGSGGSGRVAPSAEPGHDALRARREAEPTHSAARRRRFVAVVGAGPGGFARVASAAECGHNAPLGKAVGDKWWATLRRGAASLTETVGRVPFEQYGRRAGEGAR
jgi:hypothetical protein